MLQMIDTAAGRWVIASTEAELTEVLPTWATLPIDLAANNALLKGITSTCFGVVARALSTEQPIAVLASGPTVLGLHVPNTGRVNDYWHEGDEPLRFTIVGSPRIFTLDGPLREKAPFVLEASKSRTPLLVLAPGFETRPLAVTHWAPAIERPCQEYELNEASMRAMSRAQANALYARIFQCNSSAPYEIGIPFRLAQEYCEAKAEAIASTLVKQGADVGKVWMVAGPSHPLRVRTTSTRTCFVEWGHHVAVIVKSDNAGERFHVFDPTLMLEEGVLPLSEWDAQFSGPGRTLRMTTAEAMHRYHDCYEPSAGLGQLLMELEMARCRLAEYTAGHGHPPFPCPAAPVPT